jgi:hypothetical protein
MATVRVAAVQASYVLMDRDKTTEPGTFIGINPTRILDTRTDGFGAIPSGSDRNANVEGPALVNPQEAAALVFNATVTHATRPGYATFIGADLWYNGVYPNSTPTSPRDRRQPTWPSHPVIISTFTTEQPDRFRRWPT